MNLPKLTDWLRPLGILLIAQGAVRFGYVLATIFQAPADLLQDPVFLAVTIFIPALLAGAGAAAGVLMSQLMPVARPFGLMVCAICLAYQFYAFGSGLYFLATRPVILSWGFWTLGPLYMALYAVALACLWQWAPASGGAAERPPAV